MALGLETPRFAVVRDFLGGMGLRAWLAGGTVRDLLLGREARDLDLVTEGDPSAAARAFAEHIGGSFVLLSGEFKTCRVISADRSATYDFSAMRGADIEADLGHRDFTINAIAIALDGGKPVDPFGGVADLKSGTLAAVSQSVFRDDPLRLLRAVRLEKELAVTIPGELEALIRREAAQAVRPAAERTFSELSRVLELPGTSSAAGRLDSLGLLPVLLPEISALKGVCQNDFHHLDVYDHTLANAEELGRIVEQPEAYFPGQAEKIVERRRRRVAGDASWLFVMGLASLTHDIAKPVCKFTDDDGQIRFFKHAGRGSDMVVELLARFKASTDATRAVSFLVGRHMRFEGLVQQPEPSQRARWRYLRATEPYTPELIMLSVSDRLTVRGPLVSDEDVENHLALAREMMEMSVIGEEAEPLPRLVGGEELMEELGLKPGPVLGRLLDYIREEQQLGNISTREEALAAAGEMIKEEQP